MTYHTCGTCAHGKFASKAQIGSKGTCEEKKLFVTKASGSTCTRHIVELSASKPKPKQTAFNFTVAKSKDD